MKRHLRIALFLVVVLLGVTTRSRSEQNGSPKLVLHARNRVLKADEGSNQYVPVETSIEWDPDRTALIICDMWDAHWCQGAAERVTELAVPVNKLAHRARELGVLVIHAPSTCVDHYKGSPQRRLAQTAPFAKTPISLSQSTRWGTRWCWPDPKREPELPIDDSDMGCDCHQKCEIRSPWTRQIDLIEIEAADAISDDGQEIYNLLADRNIDNVLIVGVHLNMCVLGRSFAIRQLVKLGKNVLLVRDLTDTMYNHRRRPFVDHFSGTDLVVEHVEKYWCPTANSADLLGGEPFRFSKDARK